ncbi:MAG: hypothetical protein IJ462_01325 [Clostridia bacterium]|nr:hypothetical protein [Clostridia bacterium]
MDTSVNGYLKRLTTQELIAILRCCLWGENQKMYMKVIPKILNELNKREDIKEILDGRSLDVKEIKQHIKDECEK